MKLQKKFYLFSTLFCVSIPFLAQSSITGPSSFPVLGETYTVAQSAKQANPGNSGGNQTWNLSTLTDESTVTWNTQATTTGNTMGSSNVVYTNSDASLKMYQTQNSSTWQITGMNADGSTGTVVFTYSDPEEIMHYPMKYNDTYTDKWACSFETAGSTYYRKGTTVSTVDGYGTLVLPNKTYSNVLRVHYVQTYKDSTLLYGIMTYIINYVNDEYMYYTQGNNYTLASIATLTTDVNNSTTYTSTYLKSATSDIDNAVFDNTEISVGPNPATSFFMAKAPGKAKLTVRSLNGIIITQQDFNNEQAVSVSDFVKGIYLVSIQTSSSNVTKKLIVK